MIMMILYISDYVGNYITGLRDITLFNHVLDQLASYYDISYGNEIRDLVMNGPHEYWFSAQWIVDNDNHNNDGTIMK